MLAKFRELGERVRLNFAVCDEKSPSTFVPVAVAKITLSLMSKKPDLSKLNGPLRGFDIYYKAAGETAKTVSASGSSTSITLSSLKKWTKYVIKIAVTNRDYPGPWSNEKEAWTRQDGLFYAFLHLHLLS